MTESNWNADDDYERPYNRAATVHWAAHVVIDATGEDAPIGDAGVLVEKITLDSDGGITGVEDALYEVEPGCDLSRADAILGEHGFTRAEEWRSGDGQYGARVEPSSA